MFTHYSGKNDSSVKSTHTVTNKLINDGSTKYQHNTTQYKHNDKKNKREHFIDTLSDPLSLSPSLSYASTVGDEIIKHNIYGDNEDCTMSYNLSQSDGRCLKANMIRVRKKADSTPRTSVQTAIQNQIKPPKEENRDKEYRDKPQSVNGGEDSSKRNNGSISSSSSGGGDIVASTTKFVCETKIKKNKRNSNRDVVEERRRYTNLLKQTEHSLRARGISFSNSTLTNVNILCTFILSFLPH